MAGHDHRCRDCSDSLELRLNIRVTDVRPGAWCDVCLLPSAFEVDAEMLHGCSGTLVGTMAMVTCPDCGQAAPRGDGANAR